MRVPKHFLKKIDLSNLTRNQRVTIYRAIAVYDEYLKNLDAIQNPDRHDPRQALTVREYLNTLERL